MQVSDRKLHRCVPLGIQSVWYHLRFVFLSTHCDLAVRITLTYSQTNKHIDTQTNRRTKQAPNLISQYGLLLPRQIETDRETQRQTSTQTQKQTKRQTQTDMQRQTHRRIERQKERRTDPIAISQQRSLLPILNTKKLTSLRKCVRTTKSSIQNSRNHFTGTQSDRTTNWLPLRTHVT